MSVPTYPPPFLFSRRHLPDTAEEQDYSHLILTTHVSFRMIQSFSLLSILAVPPIFYFKHRKAGVPSGLPPTAASPASAVSPASKPLPLPLLKNTLATTLLRTTAYAIPSGIAFGVLATYGRMWSRGDIEWKDRAWRLGYNKGQRECDVWSYTGMWLGAWYGQAVGQRGNGSGITSGKSSATPSLQSLNSVKGDLGREARRGAHMSRAVGALGGAGVGSVVGMMGYMAWRYGARGGKFAEKEMKM